MLNSLAVGDADMRRIRALRAEMPLLVVLGVAMAMSIASASQVARASATFCGSSATAANIADALVEHFSPAKLHNLSRVTVILNRKGESLELRRPDEDVSLTATSVPPTTTLCLAYPPNTVLLQDATTVSGATFATLSAVLQYRESHPWPSAYPAHPRAAGTTVYVVVLGSYDVVHFVDDPHLTRQWESCAGEEFYRVDLARLSVYPFNGCLVGGTSLPLPHLNELPD
jgi:hypothetical protein